MAWDERIARATRLLCHGALMTEPLLHVGYLAALNQIEVIPPRADAGSDTPMCDELGNSTAPRSAVTPPKLAWR